MIISQVNLQEMLGVNFIVFNRKIYIQSAPKQVMKRRACRLVLQYYLPNKTLSPEKYAHSLLIVFFPFSSESQLLKDESYCHTLQELNLLEAVRRNRRKFEPDKEVIDSLYTQIKENAIESKRVMSTETSRPDNESHCS